MQIRNINENYFLLRKLYCGSAGNQNQDRQDEAALSLSTTLLTPQVSINSYTCLSISELGKAVLLLHSVYVPKLSNNVSPQVPLTSGFLICNKKSYLWEIILCSALFRHNIF